MTSRNKILVIGPDNGCVLEFVKGIFKASELEFPDKHVQDQLKKNEGKHSGINIPWTIDTKYYTADVSFWLDVVEKDVAEQVKGYAKEENGIGQVVDAFVYVCSLEEPETFEGIKAWLPFLDKCTPAIRLCVSTGAGSGSEAFEDWCLDHEFEYVDLEQKTVEPLDKAGWDLAVDVLQTNMWDGMKQKEQDANARQQQSNPYDDDDEDLYRELRQLKLDDKPNKAAEEDDLDDLDDMPSASEVRQMQQQLFGDFDKEDGLDKALQTMQALREQGQNLPDDERRKLAAKVALSFAAQLGIE